MTLDHKTMHFEVKAGDGGSIEGYASVFGEVDKGGDEVAPGAFANSLAAMNAAGRQVKMLWQHDPGQPIGIWDEVSEDSKGLQVKGRLLTDLEKGREVATLIKAGVIDGLSIGYRTLHSDKGTQGQRILREVELWEVSLVTFPMLPSARVDAAKAAELSRKEFERLLTHDAGLTRSVARALMSGGLQAVKSTHDAGGDDLTELAAFMRSHQ